MTFNINKWELAKLSLLIEHDIKTKIDSLFETTQDGRFRLNLEIFYCECMLIKLSHLLRKKIPRIFRFLDKLIYFKVPGLTKFLQVWKCFLLYLYFLVKCNSCPEGWVRHGKSCYLIINIPTLKQSDARMTCQNLGGDLAIVRSSDENDFIFDLVKKQKTVAHLGVWLGSIRKADYKFYWIDDTPLEGQFSEWTSGEPNNHQGNGLGDENCVNMFGTGVRQGKWNDLWCNLKEWQLKNAPTVLCQKKAK